MEALKIKTESAAKRCEICHQSDLFDAETHRCERCTQIDKHLLSILETENITIEKNYSPKSKKEIILIILASVISAVFSAFYLLLWANLFSEYGIWYEYGALGTFVMFVFMPTSIGFLCNVVVKKRKVKSIGLKIAK